MFRFTLPENAFKCKGTEVVNGKVFVDGELIVQDDIAEMISPALVNFYGVTSERLEEIVQSDDTEKAPALTTDQTKK